MPELASWMRRMRVSRASGVMGDERQRARPPLLPRSLPRSHVCVGYRLWWCSRCTMRGQVCRV